MSKPIPAINRYKADLREFTFLLFEQFELDELLGKAPFDAWGEDECKTTLDRVLPLGARGHRARSTRSATTQGCQHRGRPGHHADRLQGGLEEASTRPAGSRSRVDAEYGGAGAPRSLQVARRGDDLAARTPRSPCTPALALRRGRGHRVVRHARSRSSSTARACSAAQWGGTMCLTEPQAGSDVGSAKTTRDAATPTAATPSAARRSSSPAATTTSPRTSSTSCSRASTARRPAPRA